MWNVECRILGARAITGKNAPFKARDKEGLTSIFSASNRQDYVPLLRVFPSQSKEANKFRLRRDVYMNRLLGILKEKIANGTDKPCITGNILKDPEAKLNEGA